MIEFPDDFAINWWIEYISNSDDEELKKYLPKTDEEWKNRVLSVIKLIKMSLDHEYISKEIHHIGALIFYKINRRE